MKIQLKSKNYPLPTNNYITECENSWNLKLPNSYKNFLLENNGGILVNNKICFNNSEYAIERFLSIFENSEDSELSIYDIDVILAQIEERLTNNPNLIGNEILPIALLFAGNFICLDFRNNKQEASVCMWNHEQSKEFSPFTYNVASNFDEFCKMLV